MNAKQAAAFKAVSYVKDGMIVGLGRGSTAYWAIQYLGERVQQGLKVTAVATSDETERLAREVNIDVQPLDQVDILDVDIDGADEVDKNLNLIKGGGGALLREKIVAVASKMFIVIADESKLVENLGKFPLPVEVIPFGYTHTAKKLAALGCKPVLRIKERKTFITDNSNYILDCHFNVIADPAALQPQINAIAGVVESGLFVKVASKVIVGSADGTVKEIA
ncbi:MAG: ribose-5-phosphate isomerase RpiA [Terrimonas sp.]|nr:ribose-5-phosphate isomerase RpiA [Terrimonas sp.]